MRKGLTTQWTYDSAVNQLKPLVAGWQKKTLEIVRLLYRANQEISNSGYRSDIKNMYRSTVTTSGQLSRGYNEASASEEPKTWEQFCIDVGIEKRTANRWLALYDPDEDRLLSTEEAKERALAIRDALFEDVRNHRISQPDWKPERWNDRLESQYKIWLIEKGYDELPEPEYYGPLPPSSDEIYIGEFGTFNRTYFDDIAIRVAKRTRGDGAIRFSTLVDRVGKRVPKGIEARFVARIPEMALAGLEEFPPETRKEIAILCAEVFRDAALEECSHDK